MKISPEIPNWLLNILNVIDFNRIGKLQKYTFLSFTNSYCNSNLSILQKNKKYITKEKKIISADFDNDLLDILNQYEFSNISDELKNQITNFLNNFVKSLPQKKIIKD